VSQNQKKLSLTHTYPDHQSSFSSFLHLLQSMASLCILPVQFTYLTVFLYHLSPGPLWSTSWSGTLHFILHTFLHPIIALFSQHMPIPSQPDLLIMSLSTSYLNITHPSDHSHLCSLKCHLNFISFRTGLTSTHNCCTVSLL